MPTTEEQVRRKARVLAAWMSPQDAQGFAKSFALDQAAFIAGWKKCVSECTKLAMGYTPPRVEDLPPAASPHIQKLTAHPDFAAIYPSSEFKMVELGKIIAYQHWMDTDVSDGVHGAGSGDSPDLDFILSKCLPLDIMPAPGMYWMPQPGPNGHIITIASHNNTLQYKVGWNESQGLIQFAVHAGANLMLVHEHQGRYILTNGYHRAWWLRSRNVEMVPVAVQHVAGLDTRPNFIHPNILLGARPPLVDDFQDDRVSLSADVRSMLRVVRISAEVSFLPRLL